MQKHGRKDFVMLDDDECDQDFEEPTIKSVRDAQTFCSNSWLSGASVNTLQSK